MTFISWDILISQNNSKSSLKFCKNLMFLKVLFMNRMKVNMLVTQSLPTLRLHGLSMEFSRQEYCSGLPFPSPGDLPDSGIEPRSSALQAGSLPFELTGKPCCIKYNINSIHCLAKLMYSHRVKNHIQIKLKGP